jgi:EmrB/QacA subfamily drug resistance transporter
MEPGPARKVATTGVLLSLVVAAFETTVVTSAMPTIVGELGGRALYPWVFSGFLMASTVSVLLAGRLADQLGRRPVFAAGMALFLTGSALCGAATSMTALIAFRVLQGFGAGALQPIATTISGDIYTLQERTRVQALITAVWGGASVLGPLIGGWIVMHASWRWVFYVNVPFGVAAAALLLLAYRDPPRKTEQRVQVLGPLLGGSSAAALLGALELGGAMRIWMHLLSGLMAALFVWHERTSETPLFPPHLVKDRTVASGLIGGFFVGGLLYSASAYLPLYVAENLHGSPLRAGFAVVPVLVGWSIGAPIGVRVLIRGGVRASMGGGLVVSFLGASLLAGAVWLHAPFWLVALAAVLVGLGLGPAGSSSTIGPQQRVPWSERAHVTSAVFSTRMLGGALTVALLSAASGHIAEQFLLLAGLAGIAVVLILGLAPGPEGLRPRATEPVRAAPSEPRERAVRTAPAQASPASNAETQTAAR